MAGLEHFSIRRRAEASASADTRTLKRALYDDSKNAVKACATSGGGSDATCGYFGVIVLKRADVETLAAQRHA